MGMVGSGYCTTILWPSKNALGSTLFAAQLVKVGRRMSVTSTSLLNLSICSIFSRCSSSWLSSWARINSLYKIDLCISRSILVFSRVSLSKSYSAFCYNTLSLSSAKRIEVSLIFAAHSSNSLLSYCRPVFLSPSWSQSPANISRFFSMNRHFFLSSCSLRDRASLLSSSFIYWICKSLICLSLKSLSYSSLSFCSRIFIFSISVCFDSSSWSVIFFLPFLRSISPSSFYRSTVRASLAERSRAFYLDRSSSF